MNKNMVDSSYKMYLNEIRKVSRHLHDNTDCSGSAAVAGLVLAAIDELISIGGEKATLWLLISAADVITTTDLKPRAH